MEPSDEELLQAARDADLLMPDGSTGYLESADLSELVLAFARAVLTHWGNYPAQPDSSPAPPAEGEVAELARWLRMQGEAQKPGPNSLLSGRTKKEHHAAGVRLTRAADLLEQRHPEPVPVSERLPGPEDCLDEGWAWFFSPRVGWRQAVLPVSPAFTHWLPATVLPLPAGEVKP